MHVCHNKILFTVRVTPQRHLLTHLHRLSDNLLRKSWLLPPTCRKQKVRLTRREKYMSICGRKSRKRLDLCRQMSDNLIIDCERAALRSEKSEADLVGSDNVWQSNHFLLKTQSFKILLVYFISMFLDLFIHFILSHVFLLGTWIITHTFTCATSIHSA